MPSGDAAGDSYLRPLRQVTFLQNRLLARDTIQADGGGANTADVVRMHSQVHSAKFHWLLCIAVVWFAPSAWRKQLVEPFRPVAQVFGMIDVSPIWPQVALHTAYLEVSEFFLC